jgi:hypothetical protein
MDQGRAVSGHRATAVDGLAHVIVGFLATRVTAADVATASTFLWRFAGHWTGLALIESSRSSCALRALGPDPKEGPRASERPR